MPRAYKRSLLALALSLVGASACGGRIADVGGADAGPSGSDGDGAANGTGPGTPGSTTADASTTPVTGGIMCGMSSCDPATQDCCVMGVPGGPPPVASCTPKGTCAGGFSASCSSASSCMTGDVCCVTFSPAGASATCQPFCMGGGGGGGGGGIQLCASDAECPSGDACVMGRGGFMVCRPPRRGRDGG